MARYLMAVHGSGDVDEFANYGSDEARDAAFARTEVFNDKLREQGHWVFAGGLGSASAAIVVDARAGAPVVTDGPYLETKEFLAGFWVVEAPDDDVARELAVEASRACGGQVEVRAFDAFS
ncbi:MAG: YciI family protein [Marmoricola sp.]